MTSQNILTVFELKTGKPAMGKYILENETTTQYVEDGVRHRNDGPAVIYHSGKCKGDIEWWWQGKVCNFFEDWCHVSEASEELITILKLQYIEQINEEYQRG